MALLQAVDDMNGKELNGRQVYVGRAQKKGERQNELKRKFEQMKQDRMTRYQVNRIMFWKLVPMQLQNLALKFLELIQF